MAEILFEPIINLAQDFNCTHMGNEPDNRLYQYGIVNKKQVNDKALIDFGQYTDFNWEYTSAVITAQAILKLGIKCFPQVGACAYANLANEDRSIIVAPLFPKSIQFAPPTFVLSLLGTNSVRVTITNPSNVTYDCFRVVFRNEYFAEEYITYELTIDIPYVASGTYVVSVWGYLDENLASKEAYQELTI